MKKMISIACVFLMFGTHAQVMWQMNKDTVITWYYREGDEFNGNRVNTNYWEYTYGWGRSIFHQKEQEYYTDGQNLEVKNGLLTLNAKKQQITARTIDYLPDNDSLFSDHRFMGLNKRTFNYTAGMIQSRKEMLYGYFEIKFTMSPNKGYWPAFWLYGGTPNEEIDFCELKTEKKNKIHVGRHSQKDEENSLPYFLFKKKLWGDWVTVDGDLTKTYNVIAGEWDKDYIKYYLNGECIAYTKLSMGVPKRLVANIAVPGGPFKPWPDAKDPGYAEFNIDYIRVWSREPVVRNNERQIPTVDSVPVSRALGRSALRSKGKFLYGKRAVHKNEGILVSLFPVAKNRYSLGVLGKTIPPNSIYTISDSDGKKIKSEKLTYGENLLSLDELAGNNLKLELEVFGKKASYILVKH